MGKYLLKRLLHGLFSVICVVLIVMVLIYSLLDRGKIFSGDPNFNHTASNNRITYQQSRWEAFGYLDYVPYVDYVNKLAADGQIDEATRAEAVKIAKTADKDSEITAQYVAQFTQEYQAKGYQVVRLDADTKKNGQVRDGGQQTLFATKDIPLYQRAISYFTKMFFIDNIHYVPDNVDIGKRGIQFT